MQDASKLLTQQYPAIRESWFGSMLDTCRIYIVGCTAWIAWGGLYYVQIPWNVASLVYRININSPVQHVPDPK